MLEVKIDTSEMEKYMAGLIALSNKSAGEVVKEQAAGLARELMHVAQPFGSDKAAQKKGLNATKRALILSVIPVDRVYEEFRDERIKKLARKKDHVALTEINKNIPKLKDYQIVSFSEDLHQINKRNKRYDIRDSSKLITFDKGSWKNYLKKLQDRVGQTKAGWAKLLRQFNLRIPAWIAKHVSSFNFGGVVSINTENTDNPKIEFSNITGKGDADVVRQAMERQIGKMKRLYEFRLNYYLKHGKSPKAKDLNTL